MMGISNIGRNTDFNINQIKSPNGEKDMVNINLNTQKQNNESMMNQKITTEELDKISEIIKEKLDKLSQIFKGEARFELERDLDILIVKIVDKETEKVIRQIPPEVSLKLAKALNDIEGILLDEIA